MQEVWILLGAPGTGIASEPHNRGPDSIPLRDYTFPLLRLMNAEVHGDESEEPRCFSMLHYLVIEFIIFRDNSGARSLTHLHSDLLGMYCGILRWHETAIAQRARTVEPCPW